MLPAKEHFDQSIQLFVAWNPAAKSLLQCRAEALAVHRDPGRRSVQGKACPGQAGTLYLSMAVLHTSSFLPLLS